MGEPHDSAEKAGIGLNRHNNNPAYVRGVPYDAGVRETRNYKMNGASVVSLV